MPKKRYDTNARLVLKDTLLREACLLFAQHGVCGTKLTELCQNAKISRSFFYRFFASKEAVAKEIALTQSARACTLLREHMRSQSSEHKAEYIEAYLRAITDPQKSSCYFFSPGELEMLLTSMSKTERAAYENQNRAFAVTMMSAFGVPLTFMSASVFYETFLTIARSRFLPLNGVSSEEIMPPFTHETVFDFLVKAFAITLTEAAMD